MFWFLLMIVPVPLVVGVLASILVDRVPGVARTPVLGAAAVLVAFLVGGARLVVGGEPASTSGLLVLDGLAALVGSLVAFVAVVVLAHARRHLRASPGTRWFWAWSGAVLTGTLVVTVAGGPVVLAAGWLLTSAAVVGLVGHRRSPRALAAARRTARALLVGDVALLGAVAVVVVVGGVGSFSVDGAPDLAEVAWRLPIGVELTWGTVAALLLVLTALVRAGSPLLPSWLPLTVEAPTPVSALLHAGVVNGGAVLLLRFGGVLDAQAIAGWALGTAAALGTVLALVALRSRPDVKGELAVSTSAQMGFMLLAVAAAVPAAALAHLVGHALYKSTRFLGAGGAPGAATAARRHDPRHRRTTPPRLPVEAGALVVTATLVAAAVLVWPSIQGPKAWFVLVPTASVVLVAARTWLLRSGRPLVLASGQALVGGAVVFALVLAGGGIAEAAAGDPSLASGPPAPLLLLGLVALAAAAALARRRAEVSAALVGLARRGRSPRPALVWSTGPVTPSARPTLRSAW